VFSVDEMLPAAGQGALGIEVRVGRDDVVAALQPLAHAPTAWTVSAERAVSRMMGGSCSMPLAAHATLNGARLHVQAAWGDVDGVRPVVRAEAQGEVHSQAQAQALGESVARELQALVQTPFAPAKTL
jgi:hydroxymethylbilane synthase